MSLNEKNAKMLMCKDLEKEFELYYLKAFCQLLIPLDFSLVIIIKHLDNHKSYKNKNISWRKVIYILAVRCKLWMRAYIRLINSVGMISLIKSINVN